MGPSSSSAPPRREATAPARPAARAPSTPCRNRRRLRERPPSRGRVAAATGSRGTSRPPQLPVLTPWLAGQWVNLVTPIPRRLAVPIIESLQFDCVVHDHEVDAVIPPPIAGLTSYRRAVRLALTREREGRIETGWRDGGVPGAPSDPLPSDPDWADGSRYAQRAVFFPRGLAGRAYRWAILPFHGVIFAGMANRITAEAVEAARSR
ncbi:DUF2867 domain-containing protein [Agromyces sp. MMS17-SY077]|uniref:DUF2867 domain-containing protein n=1 Tax=Agromyces seonyuensis TaxID=2662446 RepID=A0A6I4P1B4_9MICO|nr:DUF2867 domain-containing protein [Agromyces seonyuensis]